MKATAYKDPFLHVGFVGTAGEVREALEALDDPNYEILDEELI